MKRWMSILLALVLTVSLAACGGQTDEAPDLNAFFTSVEENYEMPMLADMNEDPSLLDAFYPGLSDYELKQSVMKMAMISAVAFELALVECADEGDVEAVREIFQNRIDSQVQGGAMYPATIEAWQNGEIIVNGSVVALIVGGDYQADLTADFNELLA